MQKNEISNISDDEIDLTKLLKIFWQGKWYIITGIFIFSVLSIIYSLLQPNVYNSEALLYPADDVQNNSIGQLAGQFGGLASLAGIDLNSESGSKAQLAIEILKSRHFIGEFIQRHKLLPSLMAAESWDFDDNKILYDSEIYNESKQQWVREVSPPFNKKPSLQEAYKEFSKIFSITSDTETGTISISVEHISPYEAQQWVVWLVEDINKVMKDRDVTEANKSTYFLTEQLKETKIADIRSVLYNLIEEQAKTIMFANVHDEYVFKTIDPALVPEEKSGPKRALLCILGALLGAIIGVLFVTIRYFKKENTYR